MAHSTSEVTLRPGSAADSYAVFRIFEETLADLSRRLGIDAKTSWGDEPALARMWRQRRSLYEHLAETAEQYWLAERDGEAIGFSRAIVRDGLHQLTELFVRPSEQSAGVGRELLSRAFAADGARRRVIIASLDTRAQARYLKMGLYPQFPIYYFWRVPEAVERETDLEMQPVESTPDVVATVATLDKAILGHRRDVDHRWLLQERHGYLYLRHDQPAGYGYLGRQNGPFALLDAGDFPAVLAHAERGAAQAGRRHFGLEVPMANREAVDYLLGRGFRIDSFIALFMSEEPFGHFERYIVNSPPFVL